MERNLDSLLLIFIKNPIAGNVKTRLARTIGDAEALKVYQQLLRITYEITFGLDCDRQVWYSKFIDENDRWEEGDYKKRLQSGESLGQRMKGAFEEAFLGGYEKVVIIGSDCADLSQGIIEQAFETLKEKDVVVGPSQDGGYYLLGMDSMNEELFTGIDWSTPRVLEQTEVKAREKGLSVHHLPTLNDIDTEEDMLQSAARLGRS